MSSDYSNCYDVQKFIFFAKKIKKIIIVNWIKPQLTLHNATPVSSRSIKLSTLIRSSGYIVFIHSAKSSRIAYKYSSLDLNGRYGRASKRTVAILTVSFGSVIFRIENLFVSVYDCVFIFVKYIV